MQFCTYLPAYLYFRTETKAVLVLKFTTLTSHSYTYITIGNDTLQCISSSPTLLVCHLSLSYFSHISLHLSSHQSPPSLTILPLCNDSQYKPLSFKRKPVFLSPSQPSYSAPSRTIHLPPFSLFTSFCISQSTTQPLISSLPLSFPLTPPLTFHLHPFSCVAV